MSSSIPTSKIDMSLDDIIKNSRGERKPFGGRRKFGERRMFNKNNRRGSETKGESSVQNQTQSHQAPEKRTRLLVSNIQKDVINSELRVCFKKIIMS